MKHVIKKLIIIWHVLRSDECAVYCSYNDKPEIECYIREDIDSNFIETVIYFTEKYKNGEFGRPMPNDPE